MGLQILVILVLILANGFFAAAELAVVSARRGRLEAQAAAGSRGARLALALTAHPERFLATVGVGIELIGTFTAAFGGDQLGEELAALLKGVPALAEQENLRKTLALVLVVVPLTLATMLLGELVPKGLALRHAERIASLSAPLLSMMARVLHPLVALLTGAANMLLRLLGQAGSSESPITEEDIVYLARRGSETGTVEPAEAQYIHRVFQFTDRAVRAVMTPRHDLTAVDLATPLTAVVQVFLQTGHARLPVYEGALDNVVGILHTKDVLRALTDQSAADLRALVHPAQFVLEHQPVDEVLALLRKHGTPLALVADEYGSVVGLISITDLLEELVGDLPDDNAAAAAPTIVQRDATSWLVDGQEAYDTVCTRLALPALPEAQRGGYTTVGGVLLARLGRIPATGDTLQMGDTIWEVVDMDGRRVDQILIRRQATPASA